VLQLRVGLVIVRFRMHQECGSSRIFLLPLPALYKVSRFRVCFRFQLLSSKCLRFHKNLTASTSLTHEKCFRFRLLKKSNASEVCFLFHKNLTASTASASTSLVCTFFLCTLYIIYVKNCPLITGYYRYMLRSVKKLLFNFPITAFFETKIF